MSRYGGTPSLARHRSWIATEGISPKQASEESSCSPGPATLPSASPAPGRHSDRWQEYSLPKKNKMHRNGGCKSTAIYVLVMVVFFVLEWRYLSSLGAPRLSSTKLPGESAPAFSKAKRFEESSRPMFERLLGLAAHALAEGDSRPEPDDLWKEPTKGSSKWRPCADNRAAGHIVPPETKHSSGYIMVSADGGLNQQRVAICNAVAVARLLNATLVLPQFLVSSVWRDSSQFDDIYEEDYFMNYLKDDVHIVSKLPLELQSLDLRVMDSILYNADVPKESKPSFFVDLILPILLRNRVIHFYGFENALSFDPIPYDIQRLRCRCNFHALKFKPHIRETAGIMIKRMREKNIRWGPLDNSLSSVNQLSPIEKQLVGSVDIPSSRQADKQIQADDDDSVQQNESASIRYLGLHLRFEIDMVAYSLCEFGGGEPERQELEAYRKIHFPTASKYHELGKSMPASVLREIGRCPLTPEEGILMLASLGFKRSTRIFLAGADIYGGQARMAPLTYLYPNLVRKEDLLTPEELVPFVNHSSQMAALDFIGCAAADAFAMTDSGSQLSSLASGFRIYHGEGRLPTIRPNKKRMVGIFAQNMTIEWEEFEEKVRKLVKDSKRLLVRPIARSIYRHPRCNDCMCH